MEPLKTCTSCAHDDMSYTPEVCKICKKWDKWEPVLQFGPVKSDGGSTSYYEVPAGAAELNDLIEHKNMSFALGNIFKACYRLGEKSGTDAAYDVRKMIFFANRILKQLEKTDAA